MNLCPAPSSAGRPETSGNEWVELINLSKETVDLSNWQIDDGPDGSLAQLIPGGTLIQPDQFLVIQLSKDIFNNEGDQVRLLWPDRQIVHSVTYQKASTGFSSSRFEDGVWLWTNQPTPGQKNEKNIPAAQTQTNADNSALRQAPLVAALSESVAEPKNEPTQNLQKSPEISQADQSANQSPQKTEIAVSAQNNQAAPKNSRLNVWLILAGIITVSLLTGIALITLRRKKAIDPVKKPKNVPF